MPSKTYPISLTTQRDYAITSLLATAIGLLCIPIALHINLPHFPVTLVSVSFEITGLAVIVLCDKYKIGLVSHCTDGINPINTIHHE